MSTKTIFQFPATYEFAAQLNPKLKADQTETIMTLEEEFNGALENVRPTPGNPSGDPSLQKELVPGVIGLNATNCQRAVSEYFTNQGKQIPQDVIDNFNSPDLRGPTAGRESAWNWADGQDGFGLLGTTPNAAWQVQQVIIPATIALAQSIASAAETGSSVVVSGFMK